MFSLKSKKNRENPEPGKFAPFYFISAFPKSGSSYISLVIRQLMQIRLVDIIYSHYREQDLYEPKLREFQGERTISKHHTLATEPNLELVKRYNLEPVILLRNLPDVIISLREHIIRTMRWPHFQIPSNFKDLSIMEQHDFLIEIGIPWYLYFFSSWSKVKKENEIPIKIVLYEDFHTNKMMIFQEILNFWNLSYSERDIKEAMNIVEGYDNKQNRMNKGEIGRGINILTPEQIMRIRNYSKFYPELDYGKIL